MREGASDGKPEGTLDGRLLGLPEGTPEITIDGGEEGKRLGIDVGP